MRKFLMKFSTVIFTLSVFILAGFIAVIGTASNKAFYRWQFEKNDTLAYVKEQSEYIEDGEAKQYIFDLSEEELEDLMAHTIRYCLLMEDNLNPEIDGHILEIFRADEISHMSDVREVFAKGLLLCAISFVLFIISVVILLIFRKDYNLYCKKIPLITYLVLISLILIIGLAAAINFDIAFELFHRLLFEGNWSFGDGVMIAMIGDIFTDIVPIIIGIWLLLSVIFIIGVSIYNKNINNNLKNTL